MENNQEQEHWIWQLLGLISVMLILLGMLVVFLSKAHFVVFWL